MKPLIAAILSLLLACACTGRRERARVPDLVEQAAEMERRGSPDSAMAVYEQACALYQPSADRAQARAAATAHLRLGYMLIERKHRYMDAFHNLMDASKLASEHGLPDIASEAENNTAVLYSYYDDVPNTLHHLLRAMEQALKAKYNNAAAMAFENIVVETILESPASDSVMAQGIPLMSQVPDTAKNYPLGQAALQAAKAWQAGDWGALAAAARRWQDVAGPGRPDLECVRAVASLRAGDGAEGAACLRRAYGAATWNPVRLYAARLLVEAYGSAGMADTALIWHKRVRGLEDSLYKGQKYGAVRDMFANLDAREHNEVMEREKAKARMLAIWLWTAVAVALMATVAAVVIIRQNRELRRRARVLFQKDTELLASKSQEAKESKEARPLPATDQRAVQELMERIRQVMADDALVCQPDFSIATLAFHCGKSVDKVSTAIRSATGNNFSAMLSGSRVRVASLRLRDPAYANYTIEAVAQSVGMQSRSNFAILFRRQTGINPGEYRRLARERHD